MKIGIGLPNQVLGTDPTIIPTWAARAEEAGFEILGTVGRIAYPGVMDTVALAAAAATTHTVELIPGVLLTTVWPGALLAKEVAGIDEISGHRLTLGVGVGIRPDDFVAEGHGTAGRGKRFDRDLEVYREFWGGAHIGGGPNAGVTPHARQVPLLFGGMSEAAYARGAKWGTGYIGGSMPAPMVAPSFEAYRAAWAEADREGEPRFVALAYFAFGDGDQGRANIHDYYSIAGEEFAGLVSSNLAVGADKVKETLKSFEDIGATDIIFNPGVGDLDEISRLADVLL
jgi:alkanesulfonate monooxygenase SsuD/methylene tetrahydromethanopterin reductase-like flavin-dependent oxidoreductase (luciferase family)